MSDGARLDAAASTGTPDPACPFGWFGKLPARGDFVARRLPRDLVRRWDAWLSAAMPAAARRCGDGWPEAFRAMPSWRFAAAAGRLGPQVVVGMMRPSVDRVGRAFPLTVAVCLEAARLASVPPATLGALLDRAGVATRAAVDGMDVEAFDAAIASIALPGLPGSLGVDPKADGRDPAAHDAAWSAWCARLAEAGTLWWTSPDGDAPGAEATSAALDGALFDALLRGAAPRVHGASGRALHATERAGIDCPSQHPRVRQHRRPLPDAARAGKCDPPDLGV